MKYTVMQNGFPHAKNLSKKQAEIMAKKYNEEFNDVFQIESEAGSVKEKQCHVTISNTGYLIHTISSTTDNGLERLFKAWLREYSKAGGYYTKIEWW